MVLIIMLWLGYMPSTIGKGERSDAATAYLYPAASRPNLDILVNTQVTRLLSAGEGKPDFRVVEMAQTSDGTIRCIFMGCACLT